jgi:hypothetical protein
MPGRQPQKNLPSSLTWGVVSMMLIFVLVNLDLIAVLKKLSLSDYRC